MKESQIKFLFRLFKTAVAAADPLKVLPNFLPKYPGGKVVVVGAGKASARMAEAVENTWGPSNGLIITQAGYGRPLNNSLELIEGSHPIPNIDCFNATTKIIQMLKNLHENDFVLSLISGGGSALLCLPHPNISFKEKQQVHRSLLSSNATIKEINVVRKHLSGVKGGQLAKAAFPAKLLNLLISDVPGDDLADIASGPTVGELSTPFHAIAILNKYNIVIPDRAREVLLNGSQVLEPSDAALRNVKNKVISTPLISLRAAASAVDRKTTRVRILSDLIEGEAREEGVRHAKLAKEIQYTLKSHDKPVVMISGGECTVSLTGKGWGGPNAEFVLSAIVELAGQKGIYLMACDTDGSDGASHVAGAFATPTTLENARKIGLNPTEFLKTNDSHTFFKKMNSQVISGPTLTNVNDFRAFLIESV